MAHDSFFLGKRQKKKKKIIHNKKEDVSQFEINLIKSDQSCDNLVICLMIIT